MHFRSQKTGPQLRFFLRGFVLNTCSFINLFPFSGQSPVGGVWTSEEDYISKFELLFFLLDVSTSEEGSALATCA